MEPKIDVVLVVGAGWIGRQVAAQCVAHGVKVELTDNNEATLADAKFWIEKHINSLVTSKYWPDAATQMFESNLRFVTKDQWSCDAIDLAIECVSEQASIKRKVLKGLSQSLRSDAIIASNSSYFMPSMLVRYVTHPGRFIHLHFHSPIHQAKIVDIALGSETDHALIPRLENFVKKIAQIPLVQTVENTGYIFNWILQATLKASLELVEKGVAKPEDIDLAWRTITGMNAGPFAMMDVIGLDLIHNVLASSRWVGDYDQMSKLMGVLEPLIEQNKLGVKTKHGFFPYETNQTTDGLHGRTDH